MSFVQDLDTPLLQLSGQDRFTLRDACQGVHIFGGIGSGKTTGSGATLASAYLRAGMGGIILAAKPDEVERWIGYARANGRENSVLVFGDRGGGGFNFIDYELARQGADGAGSVVDCLMRIVEAARLTSANGSRSSEQFWEDTTRQVLRNSIPVLYAATGTVQIPDVIRFVSTAPTSQEQLRDPAWQDGSFMFRALLAARCEPQRPFSELDFEKTANFWHDEWAQLDAKTRGNIAISLSTVLDRFNRGRLFQAFCSETTLVPELTFHGAIIILDMPALTWSDEGLIAQQLFKYMWQRAVLARNALEPRHRARPVFCWADEAQYFVNSFDPEFQSTCRSSNACSVFLTQSLPTYYARMGGEQARAQADMLLANFVTRIFHNSACAETNRWAAETIGRSLQRRASYNEGENYGRSMGMSMGESTSWGRSSSYGGSTDAKGNSSSSSSFGTNSGGGDNWGRNRGQSDGESVSRGFSETMDYEIEPAFFGRHLRTGGPANAGIVSGLWFQAGKRFQASGRNYLHVDFRQ